MAVWMTNNEVETIISFLDKNDCMFEWGCGGSTLEYSNYVMKYYSVEHHSEWYTKIKSQTSDNTEVFLVEPNDKNWELYEWEWNNDVGTGRDEELFAKLHSLYPKAPLWSIRKYTQFQSYIDKIDDINIKFDKILVDGRARTMCAVKAKEYLKDGGILFVHDYYPRIEKYFHIGENYKEVCSSDTLGVFINE